MLCRAKCFVSRDKRCGLSVNRIVVSDVSMRYDFYRLKRATRSISRTVQTCCASFLFSGLLSDVRIRDHPLAWLDGEWSENLNDATWTIHHYWNGTNDATATLLLLFVQCRAMPRVLCAVLYMPCYLSVCSFVSLARFSYTLRLCVDFRFAPVQTERTFILYNTTIFQTIIFSSSRIVSGFDALIVKRRCSVDSF